jgi:hypothetical protein
MVQSSMNKIDSSDVVDGPVVSEGGHSPELWPKLGDGSVRRAAYRGGWKPA